MNIPEDIQDAWSDEPLSGTSPETLGRATFVNSVAARIDATPINTPSTVFGLVGSWGSGKTSLLNQIRTTLPGDWHVTDFTPWSAPDPSFVGLEFARVLFELYGKKAAKGRRRTIAAYAQYATPLLSSIPLVGGGISETVGKTLDRLSAQPPWQEQFNEVSTAIAKEGKRVLVIVDDVDRLAGDELLTLLRIVRLLGRFQNVHYLIAYDQNTIEELLSGAGYAGKSASFMEKIVQFPFEIPPLPEASALRLLGDTFRELVSEAGLQLDERDNERASQLIGVLARAVKTPRTLGRYRQQLLAFASHVHHAEIDVLDYAAVTWLRLESHDLWMQLPSWQSELVSGAEFVSLLESRKLTQLDWATRVSQRVNGTPDAALAVLGFLVSHIETRGMTSHSPHDHAFSDENYFQRYFLLFVSEGDVSDRLVQIAIDALVDGSSSSKLIDPLAKLLDGVDIDRAGLAYSKLIAYREPSTLSSKQVIEFLVDRRRNITDASSAFGSKLSNVQRWLSMEIGLALLNETISAAEIVTLLGESESFGIVRRMARVPQFRTEAPRLAQGFADYWAEKIRSDLSNILNDPGRLGGVLDMYLWSRGEEATRNMLDPFILDAETYQRVADSFVQLEQWVGTKVSWAMNFRNREFEVAVSKEVRLRFAAELPPLLPQGSYDIEDFESPEIPARIRRDFALRNVLEIDQADIDRPNE